MILFKGMSRVMPIALSPMLLLVVSCNKGSRDMDTGNQLALRLWEKEEAVVKQAVAGKPYDHQELIRALDFLSATTGIPSRDEGTFVGRMPNSNLPDDLVKWQKWYSINKQRLLVDPNGKVIVSR